MEMIVIKNRCDGDVPLKELVLPSGGIKRLPYERLRDEDLLQAWSRGFIEIIDWPPGKEPISGRDSPPRFQLPQGIVERYGAWWPKESS